MDIKNIIKTELEQTKLVFEKMLEDTTLILAVEKVVHVAVNALNNNKKILFCGNGGSAADSQHLAAELVSRFYKDRPALASIALTTDTSALTAIGNDYGYERVFARQVEALGQEGDVLVAISTSGSSKNVLEAVKTAKDKKIITVGFLGVDGREIGRLVDYSINIPSHVTPKIQEGHIAIGHLICYLIEQSIFFNQ
jgi:D-sedoheptulose 7-phosphate isomerase